MATKLLKSNVNDVLALINYQLKTSIILNADNSDVIGCIENLVSAVDPDFAASR